MKLLETSVYLFNKLKLFKEYPNNFNLTYDSSRQRTVLTEKLTQDIIFVFSKNVYNIYHFGRYSFTLPSIFNFLINYYVIFNLSDKS